MQAGIDLAKGEYIVTLDGDLQNNPIDIPIMLEKLITNRVLPTRSLRVKDKKAFFFFIFPVLGY